ncbi:major facilitator superfamily domain-containing protein [Hyaloscypha finlandica]|nr:major facilitator superfamily domain-containing protein [Hyaloscypha finlandica]KAH8771355.1 major facilitator superfamily domain-containing protein [Hyaloscypha sp. PMI_1271]
MSELLYAIELVPARRNESLPSPPRNSISVSDPVRDLGDTKSVLGSSIQIPIDLEDGGLKEGRIIVIIAALTGVNFLGSLCNGFITIGLPRIASDLSLSEHLILWPSAVYYLTSSSCLLLAGSVADVIGNKRVNLLGCFLTSIFILACGLARSGIELIMFRAMQGIAVSLCLPTSVAIVAYAAPSGRKRNIGFSCLGFVQPIGFSLGMVLEGVILDSVGWRFSYYLCGSLSLALFGVSLWALPRDSVIEGSAFAKLKQDIDWVGAIVVSTSIGVFSYILATLTSSISYISRPANIALLLVSVTLVPIFVIWEARRERLYLPALIPNSLWRNTVFTSVCLTVLFSNAVANAMEVFCSLFFQEIQHTSALGASIRILPSLLVGFLIQLTTGLLIHRTSPYILVLVALLLSSGAPLLMAVVSSHWPYWYAAFPAQLLSPLSCDIMFTIGLLAVSEEFPSHTQALAGAVFNTVAQFGTSLGLTLIAVVAASVTKNEGDRGMRREEELLAGYRAGFWTAFASMGLACIIGAFGLRKMGNVGVKRD